MKFPVLLNDFSYGMADESFFLKPQTSICKSSLDTATNVFLDDIGNLRKRPGTYYIDKIACDYAYGIALSNSLCVFTINYNSGNYIIFYQNDSILKDSSGNVVALAHPYAKDEIHEIQYIEKDGTTYLAHKNHTLKKLVYDGITYTLSDVTLKSGMTIAYGDGITKEYEGYLPVKMITKGTITVSYTISGTDYTATDDGSGGISGTDLTGTVDYSTGRTHLTFSTAPDDNKKIGITFYDLSSKNIAVITLFMGRLWAINFGDNHDSIWGSVVDSYEDFTLGGDDADAVLFNLSSPHNDSIMWAYDIVGALILGGNKSVFSVRGGTSGITPSYVVIERVFDYDSGYIKAVAGGRYVYFVNNELNIVYALILGKTINDKDIMYNCVDLTATKNNIFNNIKSINEQKYPYKYLWVIDDSGNAFVSRNILGNQNIVGWFKFSTYGNVLSIISKENDVYWLVDRFNDGNVYLEKFADFKYNDYFDTVFVDCGKEIDNNTSDVIDMSYLPEGTTVSTLTDTGIHPLENVDSDGNVTLQWIPDKLQIGLSIDSLVKTHMIDFASDQITTTGYPKKISKIRLGLYKSMASKVQGYELFYRYLYYPMNKLIPLYTGWYELSVPSNISKDIQVSIVHENPVPFVIGGIFFEFQVNV